MSRTCALVVTIVIQIFIILGILAFLFLCTINTSLLAPLIAIIGILISSIVCCFVAYITIKSQIYNSLQATLNTILKYEIKYPKYSISNFCEKYQRKLLGTDEHYTGYDSFCTYIFNFISAYWHYVGKSKKKLDSEIGVSEWVKIHKTWWHKNNTLHIEFYDTKFRNLIDEYLKEGKL